MRCVGVCKAVVVRGGGWQVWWSTMEHPGQGCEGREKSMSVLADADKVTSVGATLPSRRALGEALLPCPCMYGGNPRIRPGGSVVAIAFLLGGDNWYAALWSAESVVGILRWAQRLRYIFVFVNLAVSKLVYLFYHLCFLLGVLVWCCYINIAGRKPISRKGCLNYK
jgi:hypothetical protein